MKLNPSNGNGNGNGDISASGNEPCGAVLVCGGGVAGIQAALDLSAAGFRVYLVEESPTIGGEHGPAGQDLSHRRLRHVHHLAQAGGVHAGLQYRRADDGRRAELWKARRAISGRDPQAAPRRGSPTSVPAAAIAGRPARSAERAESPPPFQPSEPLNEADAAGLREILARHEGDPGAMMPVLQEINQAYGYLPRADLEHLACLWQMRLAEILRVASFYDRFHLEPVGRHVVEVCAARRATPADRGPCWSGWNSELGVRAGETDQAGPLHAPHGPLPRAVRLVAGHEDRRPELRPRRPRPGPGNPGAIRMSRPIRTAADLDQAGAAGRPRSIPSG